MLSCSLELVGLVSGWCFSLLRGSRTISATLDGRVSTVSDCWCAVLLLGALVALVFFAPDCVCEPDGARLLLQGVLRVYAAGTFSEC